MINNYNIIFGDAIEELKKIKNNSIDCIITDPPYKNISGGHQENLQVNRPGGILKKNDGKIFKNNDLAIEEWIDECYRILKDKSHIYIMTNFLNLFSYKEAMEKAGFILHNLLVWKKNNATPNRWYMKNAEYILFARKGHSKPINNCGSKTVLEYNNVKNKKHPTEKPVELLIELILNSTNENDIVLDPFGGSMSTAVAAIQCGRKAISFEIDKEYCQIGMERISNTIYGEKKIEKKMPRLTENQKKILSFLKNNPDKSFTAKEISESINLPARTCSGCFTPLENAGFIIKINKQSPYLVQYKNIEE